MFVVTSYWLGSEFPWTFNAGVILKAVSISTIVDLNSNEVSLWTDLLEETKSLWRVEV